MRNNEEYILDAAPKIKDINIKCVAECERKLKTISANNLTEGLTEKETKAILNFAITELRNSLSTVLNINILTNPLTNKCDLAQAIVGQVLEKMGADVKLIESQKAINSDVEGHSFLVVGFPIKYQDQLYKKYFLVDPTYRQFFLKNNCSENKYLIKNNLILIAPDPGYYYLCHPEEKNIASKIIEDGYIELTPGVAKTYGDSFYITRRGYIDTTIQTKQSNISGEIYLNSFLKSTSSYSKNEEELNKNGYQITTSIEINDGIMKK